MLEKTNSGKQAYIFKACDPEDGKLLSLCNRCVKSLIDQLGPHAHGEVGQEGAGHMTDSPTQTTWKEERSLQEGQGDPHQESRTHGCPLPSANFLYSSTGTGPGT